MRKILLLPIVICALLLCSCSEKQKNEFYELYLENRNGIVVLHIESACVLDAEEIWNDELLSFDLLCPECAYENYYHYLMELTEQACKNKMSNKDRENLVKSRRAFMEALNQKGYYVGSFDVFVEKMKDLSYRKEIYSLLFELGFDVGDAIKDDGFNDDTGYNYDDEFFRHDFWSMFDYIHNE